MIYLPVQTLPCCIPRDVQERNAARVLRRLRGDIRDVLCIGRKFYVSVGTPRRRSGPWIVTRHTPKSCRFRHTDESAAKRGFDWTHAETMLNENRFYFTNNARRRTRR